MSIFDDFFNDFFNLKPVEFSFDLDEKDFDKVIEETKTDTHSIKTEVWKDTDGNEVYRKTYMNSLNKPKPNIRTLKKKMELAVKQEHFEDAAKLRDQIKQLEKGTG